MSNKIYLLPEMNLADEMKFVKIIILSNNFYEH